MSQLWERSEKESESVLGRASISTLSGELTDRSAGLNGE